jgi:hypothetical protein
MGVKFGGWGNKRDKAARAIMARAMRNFMFSFLLRRQRYAFKPSFDCKSAPFF